MNKDLSNRAKEIIEQVKYMTIASITPDGEPWNSPVFAGYDSDYNFYFGTHKQSQKARNIAANNSVFVAIYDSTAPPGTGEGVYLRGHAAMLAEPSEIKKIYDLLKPRHDDHFWELDALSESGPVALYKVTPQKIWMNDDGEQDGYYIDIRTEVEL